MPPCCPPDVKRRPGNELCADCGARDPDWASVKLGIFICTACSGIHRKLGTHISFVRSCSIDEWKDAQVDTCRAVGNLKAKAYYEYNVPPDMKYTGGTLAIAGLDQLDPAQARKLEDWIRNKYEHKKFAPPGLDDPYIRHKRGETIEEPGQTAGGGGAGGSADRSDKKHKKDKKEKKHKDHSDDAGQWDQQQQQHQGYDDGWSQQQQNGWYDQNGQWIDGQQQQYSEGGYGGQDQGQGGWQGDYNGQQQQQQQYPDANYGGQQGQMYAQDGQGAQDGSYGAQAQAPDAYGSAPVSQQAFGTAGGYSEPQSERRAALQNISRLFTSPGSFGISGHLVLPHGFNLQSAEFESTALKRSKSAMNGHGHNGHGSKPTCHNCGAPYSAGANFCRMCGSKLPEAASHTEYPASPRFGHTAPTPADYHSSSGPGYMDHYGGGGGGGYGGPGY